jgi:hypothetical protein
MVWVLWLLGTMDLMDYTGYRTTFVALVAGLGFFVVRYLGDYLSVRSLGILLLLSSDVLLDAALLHKGVLKLFVPTIAYVHILLGMFFVGMPYLFRDWSMAVYRGQGVARVVWGFLVFVGLVYFVVGIFLV